MCCISSKNQIVERRSPFNLSPLFWSKYSVMEAGLIIIHGEQNRNIIIVRIILLAIV